MPIFLYLCNCNRDALRVHLRGKDKAPVRALNQSKNLNLNIRSATSGDACQSKNLNLNARSATSGDACRSKNLNINN